MELTPSVFPAQLPPGPLLLANAPFHRVVTITAAENETSEDFAFREIMISPANLPLR